MQRYWFILGVFFTGCMASNGLQYEAMSETNQYLLARVRKGMNQHQVLYIMHKPYSYETFQVDDEIYDVWFYVTRATGLDQTRMVPQNLTPLTFKNGVLVGTGYNYYYYAMKEQSREISEPLPKIEKAKTHEAEDKEFEKTLRAIPQQKTPQQRRAPITPKKAPEDEKLPPNVHIISETEIEHVPDENETSPACVEEFSSDTSLRESPSDPCPQKPCAPDLFSMLLKKIAETSPHVTVTKSAETESPPRKPKEWPSLFHQYQHQGPPLGAASHKGISQLKKGMTEAEVMKRLGSTADQDRFMIDDDVYNIWFYNVTPQRKGAPESIPLIFKNGKLIGTTLKEYNEMKAKAAAPCKDCYDRKGERMNQDESEQNFNYW